MVNKKLILVAALCGLLLKMEETLNSDVMEKPEMKTELIDSQTSANVCIGREIARSVTSLLRCSKFLRDCDWLMNRTS